MYCGRRETFLAFLNSPGRDVTLGNGTWPLMRFGYEETSTDQRFFLSSLDVLHLYRPFKQMPDYGPQDVTQLLQKWSDGDAAALEELTPVIYSELHKIARRYMGRERVGHTLQTTALVNEAYVRLIDWKNAKFENRAHFFGVSAQLMRRILVDFARKRPKAKDGPAYNVSLEEAAFVAEESDADLVALDEALTELASFDERKARIVEMKFFGGLKTDEIAKVLGVAEITILREWKKAKAWLYLQLKTE